MEIEAEPEVARDIFSDRIDRARQFATNIAKYGEKLGLIGPAEPSRLWSRHILNCAILAPLLRPGRVGDIGTGGGFPGLILAIARPQLDFVLIEPMERRVNWLREQILDLDLKNVEVIRGRAQNLSFSEGLDQLTARAVTRFSQLIPLGVPLLREYGELVLMKGSSVALEIEEAQPMIQKFRLSGVEVVELGEGILPEITRVIRATVTENFNRAR